MELYKQEGLEKLIKEKTKSTYVALGILFGAFLVFALGLIFSNYYNQLIFKIVVGVLFTGLILVFTGFIAKVLYLKKISHEYEVLLKKEKRSIKGKIIEVKKEITTLPDGSRVNDVIVETKDGNRTYCLSEIFDDVLPIGKEVVIFLAFDYVTGYKDEK